MRVTEILVRHVYKDQIWHTVEPLITMGLTHEIPKNPEGRPDGVLFVNEGIINKVRKDIHVVVPRTTEG